MDLAAVMMPRDPRAVAEISRLLYTLRVRAEELNRNPILAVPEIWGRIEEMKAEWRSG